MSTTSITTTTAATSTTTFTTTTTTTGKLVNPLRSWLTHYMVVIFQYFLPAGVRAGDLAPAEIRRNRL